MTIGFTHKQQIVMKIVMAGNDDGTYVDLDQLLERIDYDTTKQSMQFTIRHLIRRGYIHKGGLELRRGKKRRVLEPSLLAFKYFETYKPISPSYYV